LDALVLAHVGFALRERATITVWTREAGNLPPDDRHRLRRAQRAYIERWTEVLVTARPTLSSAEARACVEATFGLLNSVADFPHTLPDAHLGPLLARMARAALL